MTLALRPVLALVLVSILGCGQSGGPPPESATWSVSGASSGSFDYDGPVPFIQCIDGEGQLDVWASASAGSSEGIEISIERYHGPDTYTWGDGGGRAQVTLGITGNYSYHLFASIGRTPSCTAEVAGDASALDVTVSCVELEADILSVDYDDLDSMGRRPAVALEAEIHCGLAHL